jgi:multiple sugar transport system substrate-binding protein
MHPFLAQAGVKGPLSDDSKKSIVLDPGIRETIQFMTDLIQKHKVAPRPEDLPQGQNLFASGKVGFDPDAAWNLAVYRKVKDFEWDIIWNPTHKQRGAYAGGDNLAIAAASKQKDMAWEYVKFSTAGVKAQTILGATGIPVIRSLALSPEYLNGEVKKGPANYGIMIKELSEVGTGWSFGPPWNAWTAEWNAGVTNIYNGKVSVDDGLKEMDKRIQAALDKWWADNPI